MVYLRLGWALLIATALSVPPAAAPGAWAAQDAPAAPTVPVSPDEVVRGNPDSPRVSLVINIGAGHTPAVGMLDTLRERGLRTTFFVLGWWAERFPEILARIAADGHEVASHGHSVFDLTRVSDAEVVADLEAAERVISAVTGRTTRPLWSPSAGYRDARVRRIAASLGYRPIYWTLDTLDWQPQATATGVYQRVMERTVNGSIVVLHFDSPTTTTSTAAVLGQMIDELRARGFELVTITELLTAP
jgi:peptidoglycan/xylan/chitin deacetylase (PgdA/CDA1 family)